MKRRAAVLILAALPAAGVLAVGGCGSSAGGGGGGNAAVTGTAVDDGTQVPLARAVARVGSASGQETAGNGRFTVDNAATGTQTLVVSAPDHVTLQREVELERGANDVGFCYLAPIMDAGKGAIKGVMVLAAGSVPVNGGTVTAGTVSARSRSDGTGRFAIYNVPAGMVQVSFSDPGTGNATWKFLTVKAGETLDVGTVALSLGPPPPPTTSKSKSGR